MEKLFFGRSLSGANTYSGPPTVTGGTLRLGNSAAPTTSVDLPAAIPQGAGTPVAAPAQPGETQTGKLSLGPGQTVAKPQAARPAAPAVLASLEVDLQPRGIQYLFTTPRGEAQVTAQAVSDSLEGRIARLIGLAAVLLVVWVLIAAERRWRSAHPIRSPN